MSVTIPALLLMGLVCTSSFILMVVIINTSTPKEPYRACTHDVLDAKTSAYKLSKAFSKHAKKEMEMGNLHELKQKVDAINKVVSTEKPKSKVPYKKQESLFAGFKEFIKLRHLPTNLKEVDFIISNKDICSRKNPFFLVILCVSKYFDYENRMTIRKTWGSVAKTGTWPLVKTHFGVKLVFVLANPSISVVKNVIVKEEHETFGDLIVVDTDETVNSQSKRFMAGLKWVSKYCNNTKYLLRVDEQTIVHIPKLKAYLDPISLPKRGLIIGHVVQQSKVYRGGRWAVNQSVYPFDVFPPSVVGGSYVISVNIANKLLYAANHLPYLYIEDAFITGIAREAIGAELKHKKEFDSMVGPIPGVCALHETGRISVSRVKPSMQLEIWQALHKPICG